MNHVTLSARHAGRAALMEPRALSAYADRIRSLDAQGFVNARPSRFAAVIRKLGASIGGDRMAMEDDYRLPPMEERLAYLPRYIGEADDTGYCWSLKNGIALMCVNTPIMETGEEFCGVVYHGYDTLLSGMAEACADDRVKALFVKMNTPGGVAAPGLTSLAAWMRAHRGAAGGKPIWFYCDMACSAGMWVAAQGDRILAAPMGYVGSVGVYYVHADLSGYYAKEGVKLTEIKFGANKTDGADWKPLSDEAKASIQAEIDQVGNNFIADMVAGRPQLTREALLAMNANCYFAQTDDPVASGLKRGFVDAIMSEEEAFAALLETVSAPAIPSLLASTPAGRVDATIQKEQPMADKAKKAAARVALEDEKKRLTEAGSKDTARLAQIDKDLKALDEEENKGAPVDPTKKDDTTEGEEKEEGDEAAKISASAEAKQHPHLALAAIGSKQTLAQFQATVAAHASAPKSGGALADAMRDSPRLGPDGGKQANVQDDLNPVSIYASRNKRG